MFNTQKIFSISLVVAFILILANLAWTAVIFKNFSSVLRIANDSYVQTRTMFMKRVQVAKESAIVERFAFVAKGNIQKIENPAIVLESGGETLELKILSYVQVFREAEQYKQSEAITLQDLKVGDEVLCLVELEKDGGQGIYRISLLTPPEVQ